MADCCHSRAGVNFNDWMVGGDILEGNLLANCVRESGDHGPWNSCASTTHVTTFRPVGPFCLSACLPAALFQLFVSPGIQDTGAACLRFRCGSFSDLALKISPQGTACPTSRTSG
jgi:hypothetical protein